MRLIDADALIHDIEKYHLSNGKFQHWIEVQPTIDAMPVRHGRWIRDEFGAKCGACGLYAYRDKFDQPWESPYCPNCGAKMDERKEE